MVKLRTALRSGAVLAALCASCSVPPRTGWEASLRGRLQDVGERFAAGDAILTGFAPASPDDELLPGDQLLFGVSLENGDRQRTWYLRLQVLGLEKGIGLGGRRQQAFERRVQPSPERREQIAERVRAAWAEFEAMDPEERWKYRCARVQVDAFDGDGEPLESAESLVMLATLEGLRGACAAGYRQRDTMRGRVALGDDAEQLEIDDDAYDDVRTVASGVGACELLFRLLRRNPVTRDILFEVIRLPTLWSIVSTMRIRMGLSADFFEAQPVAADVYPDARRELWSAPLTVLLNDQPALYAHLVTGPGGAPDGAAAGVFAIVGQHPSDPDRRVSVQLLASRRGE